MRRHVLLAVLLVFALGGGWLLGQQQQPLQRGLVPQGLYTGQDIGISVTGTGRDGRVYGTLVVRTQAGDWVEIVPGRPGGVVPLESHR